MSNSTASRSKVVRIAGVLALACALTGLTPVAFADTDVVVKQVTVSFDDLNLQSESGARLLVKRLNTAAIEACGGEPMDGPLALIADLKRRFRDCRGAAVRTAVTTLDHPTVTSIYLGGRMTDGRVAQR
jgi:UrcA family protein